MVQQQQQVINEKQEFIDCDKAIKEWHLQDAGFDYKVVAVFGSQSSGKSTLLNHLFSTEFSTLDAKGGRGQTTKGIWISKEPYHNILIMDVEGTDGRERGENQDFERKSALFSLAMSEILIINMFENTVGLYNGANMALLRTVLEVNLQLFQKDRASKTCLLFVLRDSTGQTPLETLSKTLKTDLEKIWMALTKPAGKEDALIDDYFDFAFSAIAHKVFVAEKFVADLNVLKKRFLDMENPDYLFKAKYHKGIPADGFSVFASGVWDKIITNRDLDLPTQQQLLAQYRCEEISKSVFSSFSNSVNTLKPLLDEGKVIKGFGVETKAAYEKSIGLFEKDACRYHNETYSAKRLEFVAKISGYLHTFFLHQLRNIHKESLSLFTKSVDKTGETPKLPFADILAKAKENSIRNFEKYSTESALKDANWDYSEAVASFHHDLDKKCSICRAEEQQKVCLAVEKNIRLKLSDPISILMSEANNAVWVQVLEVFEKSVKSAQEILGVKLKDIGVAPEALAKSVSDMKLQSWSKFCIIVKDELTDGPLLEKLRRRFEKYFRYDEKGLPRIWKPSDDIDALFEIAKKEADDLLEILVDSKNLASTYASENGLVSGEDDPLIFVSPSHRNVVHERFSREEDSMFLEAKRATVASRAEIPSWFILLTVVLGWNEFVAILRNPMLTLILCISVGGFYLVWYTNLVTPILGIAKVTLTESLKQVNEQLAIRGLDLRSIQEKLKTFLIYNEEEGTGTSIQMEKMKQK